MKQTNLCKIKDIAIQLIYIKPVPMEESNFCIHPYISSSILMLSDTDEQFNIFQDIEKYHLWQEEFADEIRQRKNVYSIACLIKTYYKPVFFESIKEYLSEKDFAKILADYWAAYGIIDAPNEEYLAWFREANKSYLMSKGEQKKFNALPEKVSIYRGVNNPEYKYGFSWTIDKRVALWFANRCENKESYVYECTVDKRDLLCYFEIRNEKEVIVDPWTLEKYKIEVVN